MSLLNCRPHTTIGGTMPKDYPRCQARTRASLAKEGWLRPLRKSGEASLAGADGVVRSSTDDWKLNEPPRPRQSKERDHLLDGASTPPLPSFAKEGSLDLPVACVSWSGAKREIRDVCSGLLKKALLKMSKLQSPIGREWRGAPGEGRKIGKNVCSHPALRLRLRPGGLALRAGHL